MRNFGTGEGETVSFRYFCVSIATKTNVLENSSRKAQIFPSHITFNFGLQSKAGIAACNRQPVVNYSAMTLAGLEDDSSAAEEFRPIPVPPLHVQVRSKAQPEAERGLLQLLVSERTSGW